MDAKFLVLFPVSVLSNMFYLRDECPRDITDWNKDKHRLNCSGPDYIYHCLLDDNRKLGEICTRGPAVRVQKGYCPEYNHNAGTITTVLCNTTTGCPTLPFYSNEVYKFPICLTTDAGRDVSGRETPPMPSLRIIITVAAFLILLIFGTICIIRRRKMKERTGSEDQEMQLLPKENETPVEFCRIMDYLDAGAFVSTSLSNEAFGVLDSQWFITIIGPSGSGKTMMAIQLARKNLGLIGDSGKKRTYHFCRSFSDIFELSTDNEEPYAIIDDFMEQYRIYPSKLLQDKEMFERVMKEKIVPKLVRVIFTIHKDTWNALKDIKPRDELFKSNTLVDLSSRDWTKEDKMNVLLNHPAITSSQTTLVHLKKHEKLKPKDSASPIKVHKKSIQNIVCDLQADPPFSIPLKIDIICRNRYLLRGYRSLSSDSMKEKLKLQVTTWKESKKSEDQKSICIILLAAFCKGVICLDSFQRHEEIYKKLCQMHNTEPSERAEIQDLIEKTDNVRGFLYQPTKKTNIYVFHHDLLRDLFIVHVCQDEEFFIDNMDIDYLITRCKLSSGAATQSDSAEKRPVEQDVFELTKIEKLVDRIIQEGKNHTPDWDKHMFMKDTKFKGALSKKLKPSSKVASGGTNEKTQDQIRS